MSRSFSPSSIFGFLLLFGTSLAFNCSIPPIYVDVHKRAVHGTDVFQYGSFMGVGTPAQNQSLFPSIVQNETSVASVDYCDDSSLADCRDATHGDFDVSQSTSWLQDDGHRSVDTTNSGFNESIFGQDELHLYTHFFETDPAFENVVNNFTLEVATNGSGNPGVVGMGQSSTLLQQLFDAGMIAARTYSLYIGSGFDRAGGVINGSNVFGGYDAGRFTGPVYNYSMELTSPNPLRVRVRDMVLNDPTGLARDVSLFDAATFPNLGATDFAGFDAEITTDEYPFSLPFEVTQNYMSQLAAVASDHADGSLRLTKPFNGTMTVVLDDGFSVTLPSEVMYNASGLSPVAGRAQGSTSAFVLGSAWLSQVYLMLDYESYQFHLAQAVAEDAFVMPETFCPKTVPQEYVAPKDDSFGARGLVGAVLGGIIGGLAVICALLWAFVWWSRGRMVKQEQKKAQLAKMKMAGLAFGEPGEDGRSKGVGRKVMFWRR